MKFTPQSISDVILIEPTVHGDERGYFMESFKQDVFENALGYKVNFIQDNESKSTKGVLRGLHYQLPPYTQAKLVRVVKGSVLDVAVDIRQNSNTFGQYVSLVLSEENKKQLFVPRGFAHGFIVLSKEAIFSYKVDNKYTPQHEHTILWNDIDLDIDWHLDDIMPSLSDKDKNSVSFKNAEYYN
jgi:dTDP-4-dehydrorhamnose 3,5-epimerase